MAVADILIIVLLAAAMVFAFRSRQASGGSADGASTADRDIAPLRDEIRELRARIHVLERALTETHGSADLDAEIERLRDR